MKKDLTELVFILDRSGSMSGLEADTIGGFNGLIEKQKRQCGDCVVTTVLFDDKYELLHDRVSLQAISPMTDSEYYVRGCTALLDAIGRTLDKTINAQKHIIEGERAEKVVFVITTDGMENASREYSYDRVRRMVEAQTERDGWEFIFLGANIDAIETAKHFGIGSARAVNYHADSRGTQLNYDVLSDTICDIRADLPMSANWKDRIESDFKERK